MSGYKLETKQIHWIQFQKIETSEGALSSTELTDSNVPSDAMYLPSGLNSVELRFLCDQNNIGGTVRIYATKKIGTGVNGMPADVALVASLAITSGGQTTIRDGATRYYVDTIVPTGTWMKNIATADNDGNDRMARIGFDALGYRKCFIKIEFTGTHTWYADITGF